MEWLLVAYKHDVLRVSICTLLYMSFNLNTGVTCASPHLICQNIFFFSSYDVLRAERGLPSVTSGKPERRNNVKQAESC